MVRHKGGLALLWFMIVKPPKVRAYNSAGGSGTMEYSFATPPMGFRPSQLLPGVGNEILFFQHYQSQLKMKQSLLSGCSVQKEMRIVGEKLLLKEGLD